MTSLVFSAVRLMLTRRLGVVTQSCRNPCGARDGGQSDSGYQKSSISNVHHGLPASGSLRPERVGV
jgi:hypothetical protein